MAGCSKVNTYQKEIYNDNSKISSQADSYSFVKRIGSTKNNEASISFGTFNGVETIWGIDSEAAGNVSLDYNGEITNGKFKVVLVTPDNEVIKVFESSDNKSLTIDLNKGQSKIKIVGNDAKGKVQLFIKTDGNIKIFNKD